MVSFKYELVTRYNSTYCVDEIFIAGQSYVANEDVDYTTLKYSCASCISCLGPGGRPMNEDVPLIGLYPNPFSSETILRSNSKISIHDASLYIYDMTGKVVRIHQNINTNAISIHRENLTAGIYFYKFSTDDQILSTGKFMIVD
jgi:hypothetical protein